MKRTYKVVPIIAALALMVATVALAGNPAGKPFSLKVGETTTVGDLTLLFKEVPNDGRCPIGLFCFWEGDAACLLQVSAPGNDAADVTVHTSDFFGHSTTYAGRTITLVLLDPYPVYEDPPAPNSYVVSLVVTEESAITSTEDTTWGHIKALYR